MRSVRVPAKTAVAKSKAPSKRNSRPGARAASAEMAISPAAMPAVKTEVIRRPQTSSLRTNLLRVLALLAVIAITVYIYSIRERVEQFEQYGYLGVFLVAMLANATVLLPAPGVAIIYAMGSVFNPLGVGLAAGTGGAIGELSGYLAGFSGQAVIERTNIYNRIHPWVEKYGGWAVLVLSAIPNPFFDVAGIAAGIAKMRMRTFLISVWIGSLIKMTLFAYAGKYSIALVESFIK